MDESKINTVEENLKKFNQRQVKDTTRSRKFQDSVGLTTKALTGCIDNKLINNMPIARESARHAIKIWRPSEANMKGKSTQVQSDKVALNAEIIMPIPREIILNHGNVVIGMDVVKANKVSFLVTVSRVVRFTTPTKLWDLKIDTIVPIVIRIIGIYQS